MYKIHTYNISSVRNQVGLVFSYHFQCQSNYKSQCKTYHMIRHYNPLGSAVRRSFFSVTVIHKDDKKSSYLQMLYCKQHQSSIQYVGLLDVRLRFKLQVRHLEQNEIETNFSLSTSSLQCSGKNSESKERGLSKSTLNCRFY